MRNIKIICRRELQGYFRSPIAVVFIVIFLVASGALTFYVGGFLERGIADLESFFSFHPWLYLLLMPALGMRLWAEERKTGTIEFLMTLPITAGSAVVGKFLAAWLFAAIPLMLTAPIWLTANYLGDPDNGVILAAYFGSWLMAGGFLAVSACISAMTRNQVVAFILSVGLCFVLMMSGVDLVQAAFRGWAPPLLLEIVASFSFLTNFQAIAQGVLDLRSIVFFVTLIALALFLNTTVIHAKKAG